MHNLIWSLAINNADSLSGKIWFEKKNWFACSLNLANESDDPVHKTGQN